MEKEINIRGTRKTFDFAEKYKSRQQGFYFQNKKLKQNMEPKEKTRGILRKGNVY